MGEIANRLGVIEAVGLGEALVEVRLRERNGGSNREVVRAEAVEQGRGAAQRRRRGVLCDRGCRASATGAGARNSREQRAREQPVSEA